MLVLSRKVGEELVIGDNIRLVINQIAGNRVTVGIVAPQDVHILRGELKALRDEFQNDGLRLAAHTAEACEVRSSRPTGKKLTIGRSSSLAAASCSR